MSEMRIPLASEAEALEDIGSNQSANVTMGEIILARLSRRELMSGVVTASALAAATSPAALLAGCGRAPNSTPSFNFDELTVGYDERHHVANGYDADVLIKWGEEVLPGAPKFDPRAQTAEAQAMQFGYNNDFVGYIPLNGRSDHGLLVVNHEYTNAELMFAELPKCDAKTGTPLGPDAQAKNVQERHVDIQIAAHGGSVIEIRRQNGKWSVVAGSKFAKRITAATPVEFRGPAAGHKLLQTKGDPTGLTGMGMIANCAGGLTPWGTWLTGEENFHLYFGGSLKEANVTDAAGLSRYGIPRDRAYWSKFKSRGDLSRFDIGVEPNEPNRFGWAVEIDPLDPDPHATPIRRTALGRFKREGAGYAPGRDGRVVLYMGDDEKFEYVYRFVSEGKFDPVDRAANKHLLDSGVLSVARFDADGTGLWLPLVHGTGPLTKAAGFEDQGEVLVRTRLAADLVGATKMDRPEDIEANPKTGKVYIMLTGNESRSADNTDAANPRADNKFGHIIELLPDGNDHAATRFRWNILVKCGDHKKPEHASTFSAATSPNGWFGNPDNCAIDPAGRLWIATDGNTKDSTDRADGIWAIETEGHARATAKHFFRCPIGAEMCGPAFTPDGETLFVAVQHPAQAACVEAISTFAEPSTRWPDFDARMPPRPAVVAITRKGGGKIAV